MPAAKPGKYQERYGLFWELLVHPVEIELQMIRKGGQWETRQGKTVGNGLFFHYKRLQQLLDPGKDWHRWNDLILKTFIENRFIALLGSASCVAGHTRILNPITGKQPTIRELYDSQSPATVMTLYGPAAASAPFIKGIAKLYEVTMSNGSRFTATAHHLVLTEDGFAPVSSLCLGQVLPGYFSDPACSTSEPYQSAPLLNVRHSRNEAPGFQFDCPPYSDSYGELPHFYEGSDQCVFPSPAYVQEHKACGADWDGSGNKPEHNHSYQSLDHRSIDQLSRPSSLLEIYEFLPPCEGSFAPDDQSFQPPFRFQQETLRPCSFSTPAYGSSSTRHSLHESVSSSSRQTFSRSVACQQYAVSHNTVESIKYFGEDVFYDLRVPNIHHYFAEGVIHHNSGKTREAADFARMNYYVWFDQITVILTSTERERLEERVWGEIKKGHKKAKAIYDKLPGHLIESKQRLVTDIKTADNEGIDVRNGMVGIPTKRGSTFVGISAFSGLKNKRVMLIGDELQFMNVSYIDSIANLNKNHEFKCIGIGNPKDISDALGKLAEPAVEIGGWDSGIDQTGGTKTWRTRFNNGMAIQLVGTDCPNMDVPEGVPTPYPYLITREAIASDIAFYGLDSIQFTMQNAGRFPRGEGSRRVITRQMCFKYHAIEPPVWKDETRTRIGGVDAAYTGIGGDRTIFTEIQFGPDPTGKIIMALITTMLVPVTSDNPEMPEHQIATFVMNECKSRNIPPENLFFDSSARGSLALAFGQVWSPSVVGIEFGGKPSDRPVSTQITTRASDYYSKKVSELWFNVRHVIMAGQFRGLSEEVMQEGIYKEWGIVGANKTEVETKKDTKIKSGRSTDLFDSLICAVEGARQRGFNIANTSSKVSVALTNDFKERLEAKMARLRRSYELTYS